MLLPARFFLPPLILFVFSLSSLPSALPLPICKAKADVLSLLQKPSLAPHPHPPPNSIPVAGSLPIPDSGNSPKQPSQTYISKKGFPANALYQPKFFSNPHSRIIEVRFNLT